MSGPAWPTRKPRKRDWKTRKTPDNSSRNFIQILFIQFALRLSNSCQQFLRCDLNTVLRKQRRSFLRGTGLFQFFAERGIRHQFFQLFFHVCNSPFVSSCCFPSSFYTYRYTSLFQALQQITILPILFLLPGRNWADWTVWRSRFPVCTGGRRSYPQIPRC